MFSSDRLAAVLTTGMLCAWSACAAAAEPALGGRPAIPGLGQPATAEMVRGWDVSIPPSGEGLPAGRGTAGEGAAVYEQQCRSCHGKDGQRGPADELVGGIGSLSTPNAERTVGSFWPYATTLFDYVRRAMPWDHPGSLTADQIYAVCAWILARNGIISEDAQMNAASLPKVAMPNRRGFFTE